MKNHKRLDRQRRAIFNIYNLVILVCCIIIIGTLYIMFQPVKTMASNGMTVVETSVKKTEDIAEDNAREIAVMQFKELKEEIQKEELDVQKIQRNGEEYYYIISKHNSLEMRIKGGTITRINATSVEE